MFKKTIHRFPVTTSTNDEAIRRVKEGGDFEDGEVFLADHQTAGRGRMGRAWESPKGKNLYISFLLRPEVSPPRAVLITLVAGAAVYDALSGLLPSPKSLKIKWPNDIYLNDKKITGILTEMESEEERVRWVVCGIGVNVNADENDFSPEVRKIATSLKLALGREIDRGALTSRLIESFEKRYRQFLKEGPEAAVAFCDGHSYLKGRRVTADGSITGTALGLSPEGHLRIKKDDGGIVPIVSGDVTCS